MVAGAMARVRISQRQGLLGFEINTGAKRRSIQIFLSVFPDVGQKGKKKE